MHPRDISILDFTYHLPQERIALYPLAERDASQLLVYKSGYIQKDHYSNLAEHLPPQSLLVFNNTKVIRARINFKKPTGGVIEIFCLEPFETINDYSFVMNMTGTSSWKCMIGGAGKWKTGDLEKTILINDDHIILRASLVSKLPDAFVVSFSWTPSHYSFAEILEMAGDIPLPPYMKREPDAGDSNRYQTIYAIHEGSVASPTAGLHFTDSLFQKLDAKGCSKDFVTLHVGAGTFKPVKAERMEAHTMHAEWIEVSTQVVENIISHLDNLIIAVGTTSARTMESLYWMGVKTLLDPELEELRLGQWEVYDPPMNLTGIAPKYALTSLLYWLKRKKQSTLFTTTQLIIAPGYQFMIAGALVTNFHQPNSTLLLLVAAAVGKDWKTIYDYALENDFRFLSYGDGSLLFINNDLIA